MRGRPTASVGTAVGIRANKFLIPDTFQKLNKFVTQSLTDFFQALRYVPSLSVLHATNSGKRRRVVVDFISLDCRCLATTTKTTSTTTNRMGKYTERKKRNTIKQ